MPTEHAADPVSVDPSPRLVHLACAEQPVASIVVLAWRNTAVIEALASVAAHCADVAYELILVLNGADEAVADLVHEHVEGAVVLESANNLGFGGGCNAAAAQARGDYLVFLNDDALVQPGWLSALVRAARSEVGAAAVGSRLVFPDGRLQEAGCVLWSNGGTWQVGHGARGVEDMWRWRRDTIYCSGAGMLVDRKAFVSLKGFDEAFYPAYFEDVDLCLRLHEVGLRVLYEPEAQLVHAQSQSSHEYYRDFLYSRNLGTLRSRWAHVLKVLPNEPGDHSLEVMYAAAARAEDALLTVLNRRPPVLDEEIPSVAVAGLVPYANGGSETSTHSVSGRRGKASGIAGGRERRSQPAEPHRVNDSLARLHQLRTEAGVAREYIRELERRLRETEGELGKARGAEHELIDEVTWLRGRIFDHEVHERVLLDRLDELQAAIETRDNEGLARDIELARLQEVLRLQGEQSVFRVANAVNTAVKSHPALSRTVAPVGRWLAGKLPRRP